MHIVCRSPNNFSFYSGPKWSVEIQWNGYGLGVRHEFTHIRILLLFAQLLIFKQK
jgi:hypothetical protein